MACKCHHVRLLDIQEISLIPPVAKFSLGEDFGCRKIKVTAEITIVLGQPPLKKVCKLITDKKGRFQYKVPANTQSITQTVTLDATDCCGRACVKIAGRYPSDYAYINIWQSYNGTANNLYSPLFGSNGIALLRRSGNSASSTITGINPRLISNAVNAGSFVPNSAGLSNWFWMFGQFVDHELDLTPTDSTSPANITTPTLAQDPTEQYPNHTIRFDRSVTVSTTPRENPNVISAFIDATNVYGSTSDRAYTLRAADGKMLTAVADNGETLLPYNTFGLENATNGPTPADQYFVAGDIRANENTFLTAVHTLFMREHNRLCDQIATDHPDWAGKTEIIFQHARRTLIGIMQNIIYKEFLPAMMGTFPAYTGYDPSVNPSINTEFSTAGYRLGHSMIPSILQTGANSTALLRDLFFNPAYVQANGVDDMLLGATRAVMKEIDGVLVDDLRNFLFGPPSATNLLDLAAMNIQRGRDHGIGKYNAVRTAYGLSAKATFADVTSDPVKQAKLAQVYASPNEMDAWIGVLIEDHLPGAIVGELAATVIGEQFFRLRSGDRFYFEINPAFSEAEKQMIRNSKLSDVIIRNTKWTANDIQADVFHV